MSDKDRERMRQTMELAFTPPAWLDITATDSLITFVARMDEDTLSGPVPDTLALRIDGKKVKLKLEGQGDIESKGTWDGDQFVVERKVEGGGKVTETYLPSARGGQLFVLIKVQGGQMRRALEFRRVYDAVVADSS